VAVHGPPGAHRQQDLAQSVERLGLTGPVAGLPADVQGLLELVHGLLAATETGVEFAEPAQRVCLVDAVAVVAERRPSLP